MECVKNMTIIESVACICLSVAVIGRVCSSISFKKVQNEQEERFAYCQTKGTKELQADVIQIEESQAGLLAVIADGIGKENTGQVCARLVTDTILDAYESYQVLKKTDYFFQSSFLEANERVQKSLGERKGGASVLAVFYDGEAIHYALVGNIKLFFMRNGELIPISKGQTIAMLAKQAFYEGSLSKTEAIWSKEETTIWNYVGKEGFKEVEKSNPPIQVKQGDYVLAMTKGIYEEVSLARIEDILRKPDTLKEKVDQIVMEAEQKREVEKENGTVFLLKVEV